MHICLITAPTAAEFRNPEEFRNEAVRFVSGEPQLGILSLAAVLECRGDHCRIVNLNRVFLDYIGSGDFREFAAAAADLIVQIGADVYGFGSICSSYPLTLRIADAVKSRRPTSAILLGGPQASVVDVHSLAAFPFIDLVLRGEAELTLPRLLEEVAGARRLESVPGLTWRDKGQIRRNPNAPVISDLDPLPSPAYHLTGELKGATVAALEMGRGCPFACTFCSTNDFFRRRFRLRSPERVLRDMRAIAATYGIREFGLAHDMFTVDRRRVEAFCDAMVASGEGFTWSCSARTDSVDEELLGRMQQSGCHGIFFGVETGSERMQKIIDKGLNPCRAKEIINTAEALGIRTTVSLITGFPEETRDDLRQTVAMYLHSARCPQSTPQLNLLAPLAETPLYWKHRQELVLDELCSDISHQGRNQDEADLELIRRYPEIFPNFYLIPTPHLDRKSLIELREFALMALVRFRWLLCALEQASDDFLTFFEQWRAQRLTLHAALGGPDLRHYYRTEQFRDDFLGFARGHELGKTESVAALLDYQDALRLSSSRNKTEPSGCDVVPIGARLQWTDIPVRKQHTRVVELGYDLQLLIDALKRCAAPVWDRGPHFYVTREDSPGVDRLHRVSNWVGRLLSAFDGRRTIREVLNRVWPQVPDLKVSIREYALVELLRGIHGQELIGVHRPCSVIGDKRAYPQKAACATRGGASGARTFLDNGLRQP
jgi:radical SAM superfamily enzyme YgiQ (UPF0313 family)